MGPKTNEVIMRSGDALYVRAGVPHLCQTTGDHSLHLAFDLVDSTPSVEQVTHEANKPYDYACEEPYSPPAWVMQRHISLLESVDFQNFLKSATKDVREDDRKFRQCIGRASGVRALEKYF